MEARELLAVEGRPVYVVERTRDGVGSPALASLGAMAGWLEVMQARCDSGPCPRTRVEGTRPQGEITFVGAIEHKQLEPLVLLLRELATGQVAWDTPATPQLLAEIERNVAVSVFVSPGCMYCPAVAEAALRFAQASPRIDVAIVRADLAPPPGGLRAVPAVAVDGEVVATGAIGEYDLAERVVARATRPA